MKFINVFDGMFNQPKHDLINMVKSFAGQWNQSKIDFCFCYFVRPKSVTELRQIVIYLKSTFL